MIMLKYLFYFEFQEIDQWNIGKCIYQVLHCIQSYNDFAWLRVLLEIASQPKQENKSKLFNLRS